VPVTISGTEVSFGEAVEVQVEYMDVAARAGRLAAGTVAAAWGSALASRALVTPAPEQQADAVAIVDAVLAEGKIHPDSRDRWLVAVAQGGAKGAEAVAVLSKLFPAGREVAARWAREARAAGRRTPAPQAPQVSAEELAYRELYPNAASPDHEVVHPGGEGQQEEPKEAHGASTGWHTHVHADGSGGTHEHLHEHVNDSNHQVNGRYRRPPPGPPGRRGHVGRPVLRGPVRRPMTCGRREASTSPGPTPAEGDWDRRRRGWLLHPLPCRLRRLAAAR